jgi:ABC-2 type transport system permease protein
MKQFLAITKKEFHESHATFRLYILLAVFLILGMTAPIFALLLPVIFESMGDVGFVIEIPEPTALDSWSMFFGNFDMVSITVVIIFCGIMSNEFSRGTMINLLTKGLKRHVVILAKFLSAAVIWTASYLLYLLVCFAYTAVLWEAAGLTNVFLGFFLPWLFGILLISMLIFGGTLSGNIYGGLLGCLAMLIISGVISFIPPIARFNPFVLVSRGFTILLGDIEPSEVFPAVLICIALICALLIASIVVFNKKKV